MFHKRRVTVSGQPSVLGMTDAPPVPGPVAAQGTTRVLEVPGPDGAGRRRLRLWLPPGHDPRRGPYPSVWFQDGQRTVGPGAGSWQADATLARLCAAGLLPPLVAVAVDNAGVGRASEYSHVAPFPRQPGSTADGEAYEEYLVDVLRPYLAPLLGLDDDPARTAVVGSSMGGLVSYHLAFRRPDVFGLAGICSPYLAHLDPRTGAEHTVWARFPGRGPRRVWLDVGDTEATLSVAQVRGLRDHLVGQGYRLGDDLRWRVDAGAVHRESAWARRLPSVLLHLFGSPAAVTDVHLEPRRTVPLGSGTAEVAPLLHHADGLVESAAHALVVPQDAAVARPALGPASRVDLVAPGEVTVVASVAGRSATTTLDVVDSAPVVDVEITVRGEGLEHEDGLTYSWLPLERAGRTRFAGRFRLPVGLGFDGALTRHSDSAMPHDVAGRALRHPLRLLGPVHLEIDVERWGPPDVPAL